MQIHTSSCLVCQIVIFVEVIFSAFRLLLILTYIEQYYGQKYHIQTERKHIQNQIFNINKVHFFMLTKLHDNRFRLL